MAEMNLDLLIPSLMALPARDKLRLIEQLASTLQNDLGSPLPVSQHSLYGLLADLGQAPSAEEIDQVRHEVWADFPRRDI